MEIDLDALVNNLKQYQQHLKPSTKVMAMVKAFAYGSGSYEIANTLQFNKVDFLSVAYADEGVELRKAGITIPIMVMNMDETAFSLLWDYILQPVIYSLPILTRLEQFMLREGIKSIPRTCRNQFGYESARL